MTALSPAEPGTTSGNAHVATVSFLASRASPAGGFWIALAGGTALARAAQRFGARAGYGASIAAMLETVAIMGPARFGVPLTQAASAPLLGRLELRGTPVALQVLTCAAIRLLHNTATTAFFIFVITGGLDAYAGTYDAVAERIGLAGGDSFALGVTAAGLLAWAAFASTVQVLVYVRAMQRFDGDASGEGPAARRAAPTTTDPVPHDEASARRRRFDPRAVALAAAFVFIMLLVSTRWAVIGACAAWLVVVSLLARGDRRVVPAGLVLAALLGSAAFTFTLVGGLGLDVALRRLSRAVLLVATATWLRSAAGSAGLREVTRRALGRLRRLPSIPEASRALEDLSSERRLREAGSALLAELRPVRKRPLPVVDAVLGWAVAEAGRFHAGRGAPLSLRARPVDAGVLILALAPLAAAVAG